MEELRGKLVELKILLDNQHNSISIFIEKLIVKLDNKDYSLFDEILEATKIQDFMNYKAAYLFNKIWDITNQIKQDDSEGNITD